MIARQRQYSKNLNQYSQKRIMFLWAIYIFPPSVCLFCCRKIGGLIIGIYKSLTCTWMWKLGLKAAQFIFWGNTNRNFFAVCMNLSVWKKHSLSNITICCILLKHLDLEQGQHSMASLDSGRPAVCGQLLLCRLLTDQLSDVSFVGGGGGREKGQY